MEEQTLTQLGVMRGKLSKEAKVRQLQAHLQMTDPAPEPALCCLRRQVARGIGLHHLKDLFSMDAYYGLNG